MLNKPRVKLYRKKGSYLSSLLEGNFIEKGESIKALDKVFQNIFRISILDDTKKTMWENLDPHISETDIKKLIKKSFNSSMKSFSIEDFPEPQQSAFLIEFIKWAKINEQDIIKKQFKRGRLPYRDVDEAREMVEVEAPGWQKVYPICPNCKNSFLRIPGEHRVYCSDACKQEKYRRDKKVKKPVCPICHEEYTRERSDKVTCGKDKCRKAYYRKFGSIRKK